jgi:hypothetical protein
MRCSFISFMITGILEHMKQIGQKSLVTMLVIALFVLPIPLNTADAFGGAVVTDPGNTSVNTKNTAESTIQTVLQTKGDAKESYIDKFIYGLINKAAQRLTQMVVNWANSGFDGRAFYVEDYGEFFKDIAKDATNDYLYELRDSVSPFTNSIIRALDLDYYSSILQAPDQFNLDALFGENWEDHNQSFGSGGWELYLARWEPVNNPFGAYLEAREQLQSRLNSKEQAVSVDLQGNNGYLSFQRCVDPPNWRRGQTVSVTAPIANDTTGQLNIPQITQERQVPCKKWETQTPGNAIYEQVTRGLNVPIDRLVQSDELGEILSTSLDSMAKALITGGLRKLSSTVNPILEDFANNTFASEEFASSLPWNNQPQVINLIEELQGFLIEEDIDGNPLPEPISSPGAVELTQAEIDVLRNMLNNEDYGLRTLPEVIMRLDQELPGPDRNWSGRLQQTLEGNRRYQKIQKRANKNNNIGANEEQILADIALAIVEEGKQIQLDLLDPDNNIDNFLVYFDKVQGIDDLQAEINFLQDKILRKSKTLNLLLIIEDQLENGDLTQQEYSDLAAQYVRLDEKTLPEMLVDAETQLQQTILLRAELEQDILDVEDLVDEKSDEDPEWGELYDNKELFCKDLVDAINDSDTTGQLNIQCPEFYDSTLIDYVNRYQTL